MTTPSPDFVSTDLGRLHVTRTGTGPPVVLWHSLFFDSRSWGPLVDALARDRTVYTVDGPSHGKSEAVHRDFTFEELVVAAEQALDRLGLTEPVDWIGNAWGGHVGIRLADPGIAHLRTLTTIGTPMQGHTLERSSPSAGRSSRCTGLWARTASSMKQLFDSLLGAEADCGSTGPSPRRSWSRFREADRNGMLHAMRSMMLHRSRLEDLLLRHQGANARDVRTRRRDWLATG